MSNTGKTPVLFVGQISPMNAIKKNKFVSVFKKLDKKLIYFKSQEKAFDLAIPKPKLYLPLIYTLTLKEENEKATLFNDKPVGGSMSISSLKIEFN